MAGHKAKIGLLAVLLMPSGLPVRADQNDRTHQIGSRLKCTCGGCDQAAGKCYHVGGSYSGPCGTAKTMLKEIDDHIAEGKTDDQVLQAMIAEYGPLAYVEPPKSGFGLVAWIMPVLYLLAGTGLVILVMKRWRKRPAAMAAAGTAAGGFEVTPEQLARARELAERETEE
jgi:cytochrome c-type biogenesis protein CcmH